MDETIPQTSWEADRERSGRRKRKRNEIRTICDKLEEKEKIPKEVAEKIMALYYEINLRHLSRKYADVTFCAIAVIACRIKKTPVGIKQVAQIVGLIPSVDLKRKQQQEKTAKYYLSKKAQQNYQLIRTVNKRIRCLQKELGIERKPIKASEYIDTFCKRIGFADKIADKAKKIIKDKEINKVIPLSIAAAAIRIVAPEKVATEKIARVTGVNSITIRKAKRMIEKQ